MDLYEDVKRYRKQCIKDNDSMYIYIDKVNNLIYRKSWGGMVYANMIERLYSEDGWKVYKYITRYPKGIQVKYERDDILANSFKEMGV